MPLTKIFEQSIYLATFLGAGFIFGQHSFNEIRTHFLTTYPSLDIPALQISYVDYLENIQSTSALKKQEIYFQDLAKALQAIQSKKLSKKDQIDYGILVYECELHLERIRLEKTWDPNTAVEGDKSIHHIPNGKAWYTYVLKRWVDKEVTPDSLFQFGLQEIEKVTLAMQRIQQRSGLDPNAFQARLQSPESFTDDATEIQQRFEKVHTTVTQNASRFFPYHEDLIPLRIARGTNSRLAHAPAYYQNNTFFYNLFDAPFNNRQYGWIYIHEGIPGHHFQAALREQNGQSPVQEMFWYGGLVEGWAAYIEQYGSELGANADLYDVYGKWEWDLIRSVRVCLDIGLNYYGWTEEKALAFWQKHIRNQDQIAHREIDRMKRWPAQVITYKYGAYIIDRLKAQASPKNESELKVFHTRLLALGDMPLSVLARYFDNL
ncbi:DUF885 domain-containing protein [Sediminicola luteus]|nr:DUF885 domain-containing protein [Sediminicola luteus]